MSAEVINFAAAIQSRIDTLKQVVRKGEGELASRRGASPSRPVVSPDDPIHALFDAHKAAERAYKAALAAMAGRHDLPVLNMSKIVQRARPGSAYVRRQRRSKNGTPEERAAKAIPADHDDFEQMYGSLSPEGKSFIRVALKGVIRAAQKHEGETSAD